MSGETQLLESARAGSLVAFEELVLRYEKKIYNYCFRMTNNEQDAEDLTQEVFIRVYKNLKSFKGNSHFSTWVYRIAHNICIDRYRRLKIPSISLSTGGFGEEDKEIEIASEELTPEDAVITREQQEMIMKCIAMLKPQYRSAIVLRDIQNYSYEEIARIMDIPIGTVKSHISRARSALRKSVCSHLEGGETVWIRKKSEKY